MKIHAFEADVRGLAKPVFAEDSVNLIEPSEPAGRGFVVLEPAEMRQQRRKISDLKSSGGNPQPKIVIHRPVNRLVDPPHRLERRPAKKSRRLHDEIRIVKQPMRAIGLDMNT